MMDYLSLKRNKLLSLRRRDNLKSHEGITQWYDEQLKKIKSKREKKLLKLGQKLFVTVLVEMSL